MSRFSGACTAAYAAVCERTACATHAGISGAERLTEQIGAHL